MELSDEVLAAFADCEKSLDLGPEVSKTVAEAYTRSVKRPLSKDTVTELFNKVKIPGNCKELIVPKVNSEIWSKLPNRAKLNDLGHQSNQQCLSHALSSLALASEEITKLVASRQINNHAATTILQMNMNTANVLGNSFQQLTKKRRQEIKPFLNADYAGICSNDLPVSEWLFGSDLKETLKSSKNAAMIMKQSFSKGQYRTRPYDQRQNRSSRYPPSSDSVSLNRQRPPFRQTRRGGGWSNNKTSLPQYPPTNFQPRRF